MLTATFARRVNRDSTTDLICLFCYQTVIRAMWESELDEAENRHECDPIDLRYAHYADSQRGTF